MKGLVSDTTAFHLRPKISATEMKATSIHITWETNVLWNNSDIVYTEIYWTKGYNSDGSRALQTCIDRYTSDIRIDNLTPQTMYIVWIGIILETSKVIYSNQLHFITIKASGKLYISKSFAPPLPPPQAQSPLSPSPPPASTSSSRAAPRDYMSSRVFYKVRHEP